MKLLKATVGYPGHTLLKEVTIAPKKGELTCLMGSNGSGKSTLIKALAGLLPLQSGSVTVPDARHLALVLTDRIATPNMTVLEAVTFGRYPYLNWRLSLGKTDKKQIDLALDKAGIASLKHALLHHLSDGQRQLVMIARALAQDTPTLLLDEPTAHLDLNHRLEIISLLRDIAHTGNKTIVMATHDLDLVLQLADRAWVIYQQQLLSGIPEDLVLNGTFDETFQLKGYDLKTGRVHQKPSGEAIRLSGEGAVYLWTKNALERHGFRIDDAGKKHISIHTQPVRWVLENKQPIDFNSLEKLIEQLSG